MKIKHIGGVSSEQLKEEVSKGGKIVCYPFTVSLLVVTLTRTSDTFLIRVNENAVRKGFRFLLLSVLFGWWGIPSGPKKTLKNIRINLRGGKNVTEEVMAILDGYALFKETQKEKDMLH